MARVTVDFSEVSEFEAMEKGEYFCVVDEVEYRDADTHGKEFDSLEWRLTVTEEGPYKGRKLWFYTSMSPKALWRMQQVFENLELPSDEVDIDYDEDTMLVVSPELAGMPVVGVVTTGTYEGRPTNNVDTLLSPDNTPSRGKGDVPAKKVTGGRKSGTKTSGPARKTGAGSKKKFK